MAISKALRRGALIEDDKGRIDTADPTNRIYLQADHAMMKRAKPKAKKKAKGKKRAPRKKTTGRAAASKKRVQLWERKSLSEIRLKDEQANYHVQRRARELGLLIERAMVERAMAALGAEMKLRLLGLPRQISAELFALAHAKGGTAMAIEGRLLERLSDALVHCKEKARAVGLGSIGS
jgi:hypothetical protein